MIRFLVVASCVVLAWLYSRRKAGNLFQKEWPDLAWPLAALFSAVFLAMKFNLHFRLRTYGYDLSAFDYALYNTFQGAWFYTPFFGKSILQEHFFPSFALFLPFYGLCQRPETLLALQALVVGLAAVPFYRVAKRLTGKDSEAFLFTLAFMMSRHLIRGMEFDFHVEMVGPLCLACIVYGYLEQRPALFYPALFVLIGSKESEWLTGMALTAGLFLYRRQVRYALPGFLISLLVGIFILFVFNPRYGTGFSFYLARYSELGGSPFAILRNLAAHPSLLFSGNTLAQASILLSATMGLSVLSPLCIGAFPAFFVNALSNDPQQSHFALYYASNVTTVLFLSAAFGFSWLKSKWPSRPFWILLVALAAMNTGHIRVHGVTADQRAARELCGLVPGGASVSAANELIPHLRHQRQITRDFCAWDNPAPFDYVLSGDRNYPGMEERLVSGGRFVKVKSAGGYTLFRQTAFRP